MGEDPQRHKTWSVEKFAVEEKGAKYKFIRKVVLQCSYLRSKGSCIF